MSKKQKTYLNLKVFWATYLQPDALLYLTTLIS